MSFVSVSHCNLNVITENVTAKANKKCVLLVIAVDGTAVQMVRTCDLSVCVVIQSADAAVQ